MWCCAQTVGRLAQRIAHLLQGKHHPDYTPHVDGGDSVTVVNAHLVQFTGRRWAKKLYRYHTGYPGGLKEIPATVMLQKHPTLILRKAVSGMLHHNTFKHARMERLKVFASESQPHTAQLPYRWKEERQRMEEQLVAEQMSQMGDGQALPLLTDEMFEQAVPTDPLIRRRWDEQQAREAAERKEFEEAEASESQGLFGGPAKLATIGPGTGNSKPAAAPPKPAAPPAAAKRK